MRWLQFILSHSIFISLCAAALCWQAFILLNLRVDYFICSLVFFATLSSYNFYWLISKYHFSDKKNMAGFLGKHFSNVFFFLLAALGLLVCLFVRPQLLPAIGISVLLTLLYSIPLWPVKKLIFTRKVGFLKTVLLAFTWTYVTVIIPAQQIIFISSISVTLLFTARFLFMLMLCIIFDSRDITVDKIHSLRSLATDVSQQTLSVIIGIVFTCYLATGFLLRYYFDDTAQLVAFFITGFVTLLVYRLSLKKQGYFFYYFLVDGLMLFSAVATFVASI